MEYSKQLNENTMKWITSLFFVIYFFKLLSGQFENEFQDFDLKDVAEFIAIILMFMSVLIGKFELFGIGAIIEAIENFSNSVAAFKLIKTLNDLNIESFESLFPFGLFFGLISISYLFFAVAAFKRDISIPVCIVAVGINVMALFVLNCFRITQGGFTFGVFFSEFGSSFIRVFPLVISGVMMQTGDWNVLVQKFSSNRILQEENIGTLERLEKLNEFRRAGVISQEEFDEKKKEWLNL